MSPRGSIASALLGVALVTGLMATDNGVTAAAAVPARVVRSMSAGGGHTLELHDDGTVWAYGNNGEGALGRPGNTVVTAPNGTRPNPSPNPEPTQVPGLTDVTQVAAGGAHSVLLRADGTVWTFGWNRYGQLGRADNVGTDNPNPTPQAVVGITDAIAVAAGGSHTLVLRADGTVLAFGGNRYGQLGTATNAGTELATPTAATVVGLTSITALSASESTSYALRSDGTVWTFGANFYGELGRPDDISSAPHPVPGPVTGVTTAVAASAGRFHGLVLLANGTVLSFGWNHYGQLGHPTGYGVRAGGTYEAEPLPLRVAGVPAVQAIAAGGLDSVLLGVDGSVWTFGINLAGELGVSTDTRTSVYRFKPQMAMTDGGAIATSSSSGPFSYSSHVLVRRRDGALWGFGSNRFGQLASAPSDVQPTPAPVGVRPTLTSIPSRFHSLAMTRVLDTRTPSPVAPVKPGPDTPVTLVLDEVPAATTAVVLNVTATEADGPGFVQVVPAGGKVGSTSTLNVERAGQTVASGTIVALGPDRTLVLYVQRPTHLVVDIAGYFVPAAAERSGLFRAGAPRRLMDTRSGSKPAANARLSLAFSQLAGLRYPDALAAVVNVTAANADGPGFLQVAPAGALVPGATSSLNVERAGQTVANQVIVPVGRDGSLEIYVQSSMHVIVDLVGWFIASGELSTAGRFVPVDPSRVLDTRASTSGDGRKVVPGGQRSVTLPSEVLNGGVAAVALNLTATEAGGPGFVQAGPAGRLDPGATSNLNVDRVGQTVANGAIVATTDGRFDLYTSTSTHLVADITGWFTSD